MIRFAPTLRRYLVPCKLLRKGGYWNNDGEHIKPSPDPVSINLVVMPADAKMMQQEGGRYTMDDKAIYSLKTLIIGDIIEYKNGKYTVDGDADYSEYSDYNKYYAKRVTTHG